MSETVARIMAAACLGVMLVAGGAAHAKQRGEAGWYGRQHHGKRMANGRRFNMRAPTVAHRTLPLGTRVKVRNLRNGKTATATVTDRGPYARGRLLDVSKGVAARLGMVRVGHAPVEITVLGR